MRAGIIERTSIDHVDRTRDTAFERVGEWRLLDGEPGEKLDREQIQVNLTIRLSDPDGTIRSNIHLRAVEQNFREAGPQAPNGNIDTITVHIAREQHTRSTVQGLGNVVVGKLRYILGENRVTEVRRSPFGRRCVGQTSTNAGDNDLLENRPLLGRTSLRSQRWRDRLLILRRATGVRSHR